jgi:hypothetical protein
MTHNLAARENASKNWYKVNIRLNSQVPLPVALLKDGQESAATTFAGIHVQLTWETELQQASTTISACSGRSTMNDLAIEIVPHAPPSFSNAALAMAMPYAASGVRIVIFYDRVEPLLRGHNSPQAKILGYVLAHEIAHVLQGIARHSDTGIMRARWLENDFKQMGIGALTFTGEDILLIRRHLGPAVVSSNCPEEQKPQI